jgi:small-conductance mechanosensitive channel
MKEDAAEIEARLRQDTELMEARLRQDAAEMELRLRQDPRLVREWLRQSNLIYGGLIGVGVVIIQPFLTATSLDLPAQVSVVAFSLAIPMLAALLLLNEEEAFRRRATTSRIVDVAKAVAQLCAFVGFVAAFWNILWIAGAAVLAAAVVGLAVHSIGFSNLELDRG